MEETPWSNHQPAGHRQTPFPLYRIQEISSMNILLLWRDFNPRCYLLSECLIRIRIVYLSLISEESTKTSKSLSPKDKVSDIN